MEFEMRMITDKEKTAFRLKIEKAINELSLESTIDMPDWLIAEHMVRMFEELNLLITNTRHWENQKEER
jgi:hypothetical protein